jgi:hypothetical protein
MDSWKALRNLSIEYGARFYHYTPTYTQANNMTNFDPARYDPAQAVTVKSDGTIDLTKGGNRFNGLVRAGSGIPADERGTRQCQRRSASDDSSRSPGRFLSSEEQDRSSTRFSYAPFNDDKTSIRGGFGVYYDKVEGNLIFSQVNVPPFVSTPNFDNGNISNPAGGTASNAALIADINAIDPNLEVSSSMNFSLGVQRNCRVGSSLRLRTWAIWDDIWFVNQISTLFPSRRLPLMLPPRNQQANINALRPYKGYNRILYRLSDANSHYKRHAAVCRQTKRQSRANSQFIHGRRR